MKIHPLFLLTLALSIISCEKESNSENEFKAIAGEIHIGMQGFLTSNALFDFINEYEFENKSVQGMCFYSELPTDSLHFIEKELERHNFVSHFHLRKDPNGAQILVFPQFEEFHLKQNQEAWRQIIAKLELSQMDQAYTLLIIVEDGKEKEIIKELQNLSFIRFAERNSLIRAPNSNYYQK